MKVSEIKIGTILSYIIILLNTLIGIFYTPFLTRMLGQSEYGLYSLVSTIIAYLTILDFGFGNAITVYSSKYIAKNDVKGLKKLNGMFLVIYILIGLVATIFGVILTLNIQYFFGQTMNPEELETAKILMIILTFNVAVTFPFSIFSNIITAYEKFIFSKTLNIIRVVALPICMTPLLLNQFKSVSLAILTTVINVGILIANTIYCVKKLNIKFNFKHFDRVVFFEIFSYSFYIFLNQVTDKIHLGVNNIIVGAIVGTVAVAVYNIALQFNTMYFSFSTAISSVFLPKISKMEAKHASDEDFSEIFLKTGRIQYLVMALILSGFILFGKQFIIILFGNAYEDSYIIACILMIPVTIPLIQNVGMSIMQAKNKFKFRAVLSLFVAILGIVTSILLAKPFGGIGAAIGTSICFVVANFFILNFYYYKVIKLDIIKFWKEICKISIPILVIFVPACFIVSYLDYQNILFFVIQILGYTILYCAVV